MHQQSPCVIQHLYSPMIGFQVTRATVQPDKAFQMCTIHKSKDFLVHQREHVSIQDLKGLFADDIEIVV
jgi:hypothetical protein